MDIEGGSVTVNKPLTGGQRKMTKKEMMVAKQKLASASSRIVRPPEVSSLAPTSSPLPVESLSRQSVLQAALLASADGRSFEDVSFFVFSRRRLDGLVDRPLPLLANSTLIRKTACHFDYLFTEGFAESGITDMAAPYPSTRPDSTNDYAYASDSDLEDEEEIDVASAPRSGDPVDENTVDPTRNLDKALGDSQSQENLQPPAVLKKPVSALPVKPGRVIFLEDFAHKTWKAFIFYAYLGEQELCFAPLRSEHKTAPNQLSPDKAPPCSPKSMYRLAEKYNIVPLKELAAAEIKKRLSTHNILEEIFSTFTSLYPDIQTMQVQYLRENLRDPGIQSRLPTWIDIMEDGRLPKGGARIVSMLLTQIPSKCSYGCTTTSYICGQCGRRI